MAQPPYCQSIIPETFPHRHRREPANLPRALKSCKALADSSRLKIVGLLAQQPYTVEQLAAMLDLRQREKE